MVAHTALYILQRERSLWLHVKRHWLGSSITLRPCEIVVHVNLSEHVEEAPHACIAVAQTTEIGRTICCSEVKILVLAIKIAHLARELYNILRVTHILLVLHIELAYARLVGMSRNAIIGDADSHPHGTLLLTGLAHHLHDPGLVGIGNGEALTTAVVTILGNKRSHHINSLACSA